MAMANPDTIIDLQAAIKGLLLLNKGEETTHHVLAMLGLFPSDFGSRTLSGPPVWDADEILIQAEAFDLICTCDPKATKVVMIEGQGRHSSHCALSLWDKLQRHPNLVSLESDGDDVNYVFDWPRDLTPNEAVICAVFKEQNVNIGWWPGFMKSWKRITDHMPEPRLTFWETQAQAAEAELEAIPGEENVPDAGTVDFGDDDLDFEVPPPAPGTRENPVITEGNPEVAAAVQRGLEALPEVKERPMLSLETGPDREITIVHGAGNPFVEAAMQAVLDAEKPKEKRKPGRPPKEKPASQELSATDFTPTPDGEPIPALAKFAKYASAELIDMCNLIDSISKADHFPFDTIETVKNAFDRLANRTAHLQFKGKHDSDDPGAINPLLEVTLCNVTSIVNTAVRDLALSPERAESWKTFADQVKVAREKAGSAEDMMSQPGAGPAISETPSTPGDGRTLA